MIFDMNYDKIANLLRSFNDVTGFTADMMDCNYLGKTLEISGLYPICQLMHSSQEGYRRCKLSDRQGCTAARLAFHQRNAVYNVHHCHLGLIEICFPVISSGELCGYINFGSLVDDKNAEKTKEEAFLRCRDIIPTGEEMKWKKAIDGLPVVSEDRRRQGADLMEACIQMITSKYIHIRNDSTWETVRNYIDEHISEKISIVQLSELAFVSPSTIYHRAKQNTGLSLNNYIIRRKMIKASEYLYLTDYSVAHIASLVGFDDYNYFSRCFRKVFGASPRRYRELSVISYQADRRRLE